MNRTSDELKSLYGQYLYRYAVMREDPKKQDIANQLLGAAFAYGRMLGLGMPRIRLDVNKVISKIEEQKPRPKETIMKLL